MVFVGNIALWPWYECMESYVTRISLNLARCREAHQTYRIIVCILIHDSTKLLINVYKNKCLSEQDQHFGSAGVYTEKYTYKSTFVFLWHCRRRQHYIGASTAYTTDFTGSESLAFGVSVLNKKTIAEVWSAWMQ